MKLQYISIFILAFIPSIIGELVEATYPYCNQYNQTTLYFDKGLLKEISKNQYLLKNFDETIQQEGARLDYYIRFLHIAKGLCYYDDERAMKSLSDTPVFNIEDQSVDLRYVKTVNCYYMYNKYLAKDVPNNNIPKPPCGINFATYYNAIYYFILNETLCPYPQSDKMVSLGDKETINNARIVYLQELRDIYDTLSENEECYDDLNEEVVNCGFLSHMLKVNYCSTHPNDECCRYQTHIQNNIEIKYDVSTTAIVTGVSTAAAFLAAGIFSSFKSVKAIKAKQKIEEAVAKQERMYQNKQNGRRGSGYSSGYTSDNYNSHSNYSSLNPPSQAQYNSKNAAIRSPQPLPASPADISNYNSSVNLLPGNNNLGSSSNNLKPRVPSIYSQSSVDIGSDYSFPLEVPVSPAMERPSSVIERPPRTPQLERPTTPNLQRPATPNYQRPMSPNYQRPTTPNVKRPSAPNSPMAERPPRTPELERPITPRLEFPSSPSME